MKRQMKIKSNVLFQKFCRNFVDCSKHKTVRWSKTFPDILHRNMTFLSGVKTFENDILN